MAMVIFRPIWASTMAFLRFRRFLDLHPNRQVIYEATLRRMVTEALNEKEACFAAEHSSDTDAQLIAYLRQCAAGLGYTPHAKVIVGWQYLLERFGTWEQAIRAARLPLPTTPNTPSKFQLVTDEYEHQQMLYRQRKAEKKQKHQQRLHQQAVKRKQYELEKANNNIHVGAAPPLQDPRVSSTAVDCPRPQVERSGCRSERQPASGTTKAGGSVCDE